MRVRVTVRVTESAERMQTHAECECGYPGNYFVHGYIHEYGIYRVGNYLLLRFLNGKYIVKVPNKECIYLVDK